MIEYFGVFILGYVIGFAFKRGGVSLLIGMYVQAKEDLAEAEQKMDQAREIDAKAKRLLERAEEVNARVMRLSTSRWEKYERI